jgi:hypothetical protein
MKKYSEAFVGFDTAKKKHAVAIADAGRDGEVRYFGEIGSSAETVARVIASWQSATRRCMFVTKLDRLDTGCSGIFGLWVMTALSWRRR